MSCTIKFVHYEIDTKCNMSCIMNSIKFKDLSSDQRIPYFSQTNDIHNSPHYKLSRYYIDKYF